MKNVKCLNKNNKWSIKGDYFQNDSLKNMGCRNSPAYFVFLINLPTLNIKPIIPLNIKSPI